MTHVYQTSEFQEALWKVHESGEPASREAVAKGEGKYDNFDDFAAEVFARAFTGDKVERSEEVADHMRWAQKAHEALGIGEGKALLERCEGNNWWAGMAATSFMKSFMEKVAHSKEKVEDPTKDEEVAEYLRRLAVTQKDEALKESIEQQAQQAQSRADAKRKHSVDAGDLIDPLEVRNAAREAAIKVNEAIDAVDTIIDGVGLAAGEGLHSGRDGRNNMGKKLAKVVANNPRIFKIMELAGRLRRIAVNKQKSKPKKSHGCFTGIEMGADFSRVVPSEMMDAMDPVREVLFARKLMNKSLLQYETKTREKEAKGPIVMLLDKSASMNANDADSWAAAVAMAFMEIAARQKRAFCVMMFGVGVVGELEILPGEYSEKVSKLMEIVGRKASEGGTSFEGPITKAVEKVKKQKVFEKADIVMVTDGACHVTDQWLMGFDSAKSSLKFSFWSILVGNAGGQHTVEKFSDDVVFLANAIADDEKMHHLFAEV